jgi:transposase
VLTGVGLAVEIGDWHRFTGATVGAWLGLVPSEQSSGGRRSQGSITKTGNPHARRLLVEAAWHPATRSAQPGTPRPSPPTARCGQRTRRRGQPPAAAALVPAGRSGKRSTISVVAIARELAGWCWSLAVLDA